MAPEFRRLYIPVLNMNPIAWRVYFEGIVQHVHFRASIWRIAAELGVHGWVQNSNTGCAVVAHLEGEHVQTLIESVTSANTFSNAIPFVARVELARHEGFLTFSILPTPT